MWRCIRERLLASGASTEDQDLDKTVVFVPLSLTHALEKQSNPFLQRTWSRIVDPKPRSAAYLLLVQAIGTSL